MSKIKNIQISDFRIYNGTQEFSFDNSGVLSNLMIIYAPNGFGKTSFFDAVEWCYASTIRRFESEVLKQEISRKDYSSGDKILLTNRKSFKEGKSGSVTILTSDDKIIKRNASERKANNLDFKFDYRTVSSFKSDFKEQDLNRLVKTNILTQDQIDEFLRHTKADERFFQLQSFWPEGENAVSILQKIDSHLNMLSREKQEIESAIEETEKKLKNLLNADEHILPLNTFIEGLIAKSAIGFKIEPLTSRVNAQTYSAILDTTQTFTERTKLNIKNLETQISILDGLMMELPNYLEAIGSKRLLEHEISRLAALAKSYTDLNAFRLSKKNAQSNMLVVTGDQEKIKQLMNLIEPVDELYKSIHTQRKIAEGHRTTISKYLVQVENFKDNTNRLEVALKDWLNKEQNLNKSLVTWDIELREYRFWTAELRKAEEKLKELETLLKNENIALIDKINWRKTIDEIQATKEYHSLLDLGTQGISEVLELREQQLGLIKLNDEELRKMQTKIDNAVSLEETFDKIITWGEQYIVSADANHCPLCATEFQDVTSLLEKVAVQRSGSGNTQEIKDQIDAIKDRGQEISNELMSSNRAIEDYIRELLANCDTEISSLQLQRNLLESEIIDKKRVFENAKITSLQHITNLQLELTTSATEVQIDFDQIKNAKKEKLTDLRLRSSRLADVISEKKELISKTENKIAILRNQISAAENNVDIAVADQRIADAERIMKELELPSDNFYQSALELKYAELSAQKSELENQIIIAQENIDAIQKQFTELPAQITENELPGLRLEKQDALTECLNKIRNYLNLFKPFSNTEEITSDLLSEALQIRNERLELFMTELNGLEELAIRLQVIENNVTKNALEQQLIDLAAQLAPCENALGKVKAARHTAEQYINLEINKYFNQDIINQIYSRIEPHPDLNQIRINPKVTDKGPILDIKAISSEEELDPSLYLSAGQLNVLSLSIFLAKAFEIRSDEIDTIFMDDPIQNLSDINVLSFIDLIRTMITKYDRQIVISSHDENFYKLMRNKMPSEAFNVCYYEIQSFGLATYVP